MRLWRKKKRKVFLEAGREDVGAERVYAGELPEERELHRELPRDAF